jgi:hypothetical protein
MFITGINKRHVHLSLVCLATTMLLSAFTVVAGVAAQTGQATDPATVVKAFNAAVSRQDLTGALALLDPNFQYVSVPGSALPTSRGKGTGKDEFPGPPPYQQVTESNIHLIDAENVEMDLTFSGGPIPVLPHPFMLHATFTVKNGLITRLQDRLSDQTAQELAALAPPPGAPAAMPNTGTSTASARAALLVLGLLGTLAGAVVRRSTLSKR